MTSGASILSTKEMNSAHTVLGIMAGSSMDGIDFAKVGFNTTDHTYDIQECLIVNYPEVIKRMLSKAPYQSVDQQKEADEVFGKWLASQIQEQFDLDNIGLIAAHGHTIIHQPKKKGISWQIGNGQAIADITKTPTITAFRNKDISLGGQGAPLVPKGDFDLFGEFDACLNLGGIANISIKRQQKAWDICPCNQVLNFYSKKLGQAFDHGGAFGRNGSIDLAFLALLQSNNYFKSLPPKSLPNNFLDESLLLKIEVNNALRTYYEFISLQTANDLNTYQKEGSLLVTGGGAHNIFLVELLKSHLPYWNVEIPSKDIIDFKESIVFAYLGWLRIKNQINTLASCTGAISDSSGGEIHYPK